MNNRFQKLGFFILIILLIAETAYAQSGRDKVKKGNEFYKEEKFEEALNRYRDAAIDNPQSQRIQYNIGNAFYKQGKYEEAFKAYEKTLTSKETKMHSNAYYNMGNSLYRMNKLPESILAYRRALELNPDDFAAKYNLEFVRNKLKQQMQQQQNQQQQEGEQQEQQGEQQQEEQQQQEKQGDEEQQESAEEQQQEQARELTKEEAERILDAMKNDEKDLQEKRKAKVTGKTRVKKDW